MICTTNPIESMNARRRKATRNRGQFPTEQATLNVLYLAVRNLQDYRSPSTGIRSSGWKQALQAFTIYFEGRIPNPMTATITYTDGRTLPPSPLNLRLTKILEPTLTSGVGQCTLAIRRRVRIDERCAAAGVAHAFHQLAEVGSGRGDKEVARMPEVMEVDSMEAGRGSLGNPGPATEGAAPEQVTVRTGEEEAIRPGQDMRCMVGMDRDQTRLRSPIGERGGAPWPRGQWRVLMRRSTGTPRLPQPRSNGRLQVAARSPWPVRHPVT